MLDFHDFGNAIFGGGPAPIPAVVSFDVRWFGVDERANAMNRANGLAGEFVRNQAQMSWTATAGGYHYVSAPLSAAASGFAELDTERNGSFYPHT